MPVGVKGGGPFLAPPCAYCLLSGRLIVAFASAACGQSSGVKGAVTGWPIKPHKHLGC